MRMKSQNSKGFTFEERKTRRGFTLIELLVVMTIIVILAGLSLVSYQGAQRSARDGARRADLEQIRSALEMCYADNDVYPAIYPDVVCGGNTYLSETPVDPVSDNGYYYSGAGATYRLCAILETGGNDTCAGCAACNYEVTSP